MTDCVQEKTIKELVERVVNLEKADIEIKGNLKILENNIEDLATNINEVKIQMQVGFDRVSNIVFKSMIGIISILLTALGVLVYNFIIL